MEHALHYQHFNLSQVLRFCSSKNVQTGRGDHPASCTMCTRSLPAVRWPGRDVNVYIWYMMCLLTAIGLSPSGSTHLHTNNTHNNTNNNRRTQITTNVEECGPCPVFASFTLAFALQLRKKHGKTSVRLVKTSKYNTSVNVQNLRQSTKPQSKYKTSKYKTSVKVQNLSQRTKPPSKYKTSAKVQNLRQNTKP
jgi:hypothetical protein